jgi:hypothetical protein
MRGELIRRKRGGNQVRDEDGTMYRVVGSVFTVCFHDCEKDTVHAILRRDHGGLPDFAFCTLCESLSGEEDTKFLLAGADNLERTHFSQELADWEQELLGVKLQNGDSLTLTGTMQISNSRIADLLFPKIPVEKSKVEYKFGGEVSVQGINPAHVSLDEYLDYAAKSSTVKKMWGRK